MSVASCGCPEDEGLVRHRKGTCPDPVVAQLGWYFEPAPPAAGPVAASLAGARERVAFVAHGGPCLSDASCAAWHAAKDQIATADAPALVAAVEAVLALADDWAMRPGDPDWARTRARDECATQLRAAIAAKLAPAPAGPPPLPRPGSMYRYDPALAPGPEED